MEEYPVDWHHLPIIERMWSEDDLVATTGAVDFLCDRYLDMLDSGGPSIAPHRRASPPTARRCSSTAPRARTAPGWSPRCCSALAGVPHEEIAADYHATAGAMAAFVDWLTVTYPEAIDAMTSQPPEYLEAPHRGDGDVPRARSTSTTARWTATSPSSVSTPTIVERPRDSTVVE